MRKVVLTMGTFGAGTIDGFHGASAAERDELARLRPLLENDPT